VGSRRLLPGLDDVLVGMSADETRTFTSQLVGGEYAGRDAEVSVTVRTVKEKQLPPLDDEFAQMASEFDTLEELRAERREYLTRLRRAEQLYQARDKALAELVERAQVPAPEGVVREEVEHRKQAMTDELQRIGTSLEEYLTAEGKSEEQLDEELRAAAAEGVRIQLVLDTLAEAEDIQVSDDEFGREIVHRARQVGMAPQAYYDQLVRSGMAAAVYGDVRRGKALSLVLERVKISDTAGNVLTLDELRGAARQEAAQEAGEQSASE